MLLLKLINYVDDNIMLMHDFMDGLDNYGFTNPVISSCLDISSSHNTFFYRFPFPVAVYYCNVYRANGLHNTPTFLPHGDHAHVQNSLLSLEYMLFKTYSTI